MGKRRGNWKKNSYKNKKNRNKGENNENNEKPERDDRGFSEWIYSNDAFVQYYKKQNLVREEEWDRFMEYLAKPLPTTFRINNSCLFTKRIQEKIKKDFQFVDLEVEGEKVGPVETIDWYPNGKGFHLSLEKRKVKKVSELEEFQEWIVPLTESGNITRQEAVSMIPPLFLDVNPSHWILDMCAAPGSKTSQLLEMLHADEMKTGMLPTGAVVANDADLKRANTLVHQCKRIGSAALVVTCQNAQNFPQLETQHVGTFDRILCDVPCSGDGTMRKNPVIWRRWDPKNGVSLHPLQVEIAKHGARLLKVGGKMVYSTCSFNPIENEAVVAELLRWSKGTLELVDMSNELKTLKRRQGLNHWKVFGDKMCQYESFNEIEAATDADKTRIRPSMFPPAADEISNLNLSRCMRFAPHDMNTGGFFVCVLLKVKKFEKPKDVETPASQEINQDVDNETVQLQTSQEDLEESQTKEEGEEKIKKPRKKKGKDYHRKVSQEYINSIKDFYGLKDDFPFSQLYTRSSEESVISLTTKAVSDSILQKLQDSGRQIVHSGIKVFERLPEKNGESHIRYRISQASAHLLKPYMTKRTLPITVDDFNILLNRHGELLSFSDFSPDVCKALTEAEVGSLLCYLPFDHESLGNDELRYLNIAIWRGRSSIMTMLSKFDLLTMTCTMKAMDLYQTSKGVLEASVEKVEEAILA